MRQPSIDVARQLLFQFADHNKSSSPLHGLPIAEAGTGWDNVNFAVGDVALVRLPRSFEVAHYLETEHRWLPRIGEIVQSCSLTVPDLLHAGRPCEIFELPWSIHSWIPGASLIQHPQAFSTTALEPLVEFLTKLHQPVSAAIPTSAERSCTLAERLILTKPFLEGLRSGDCPSRVKLESSRIEEMTRRLESLARTPVWDRPPVPIHGDLHPGNAIVNPHRPDPSQPHLRGIIDWGNFCAGDPATDLSFAWMAFDEPTSEDFCRLLRPAHPIDEAMWLRARGWALAIAIALLFGAASKSELQCALQTLDRTI